MLTNISRVFVEILHLILIGGYIDISKEKKKSDKTRRQKKGRKKTKINQN